MCTSLRSNLEIDLNDGPVTWTQIAVTWSCLSACVLACSPESTEFAASAGAASDSSALEFSPDLNLDSLLAVAKRKHRDELDILGAREILVPALALARERVDVDSEAKALTWLGLGYWKKGDDYEAAGRLSREALELKLTHDLTDQLHTSYNAVGLVAWLGENRFAEALSHFEEAIRWGLRSGKRGEVATAMNNRALVQIEWGEFEEARDGFRALRDTMVAMASEAGHDHQTEADRHRRLFSALTNLGMLEVRTGNPLEAVSWLNEALEVCRAGFPAGEGIVQGHLATAYAELGEQGAAFAALDTAILIVRRQGLVQEMVSNLEILAEQFREAGDFRRALDLYREAKEINAELNLTPETGADLRGEAQIHLQLGNPAEALHSAEEALRLHEDSEAALDVLFDHLTLAEVQHELGDQIRAKEHLRAAHGLSDELAVRSARVSVALTEARTLLEENQPQAALDALHQVEGDLARGGYAEQWQGHHLAARAYASLGDLESAAAAGWLALESVERVRSSYGSGVLRTAYSSNRGEVYSDLVTVLVHLGRVEDAFWVSDAARGRALIERTTSSHDGSSEGARESEVLLREIDGVLETIDLVENGANSSGDESLDGQALDNLYGRLEELRGQFETRIARRTDDRIPTSEPSMGGPASAQEVRSALKTGEALIEYFVPVEGAVRIFVLTRSGFDVLESDLDVHDVLSRVRLARRLISRRSTPEAPDAVLEGLHEVLARPVLRAGALEGVDHLIVVPHHALAYLPFEALRNPESGRFLVEDFDIRVLPSAGALVAMGTRPAPGLPDGATTMIFAPLPSELPGTRREAQAVSEILPGARILMGGDATEMAVRDALGVGAPVHVATHGVMNVENPMFSRVVLAAGTAGDGPEDGRLEVHEILDLEVRAPLVFLSGCETGVGRAGSTKFSPGEDYTTLAQAFLQAGARNVVATLWRVDDEASAAFAKRFYYELGRATPTASLASAQREMIGDPQYSSPYYWAGYQLLGDDLEVIFPP